MFGEPATHFLIGPGPLERVGVVPVVLRPGGGDVGDVLPTVRPRTSLQITPVEGVVQQLRLVQPGGVRRGQPGPPPPLAPGDVGRRVPGDMAGPAVVVAGNVSRCQAVGPSFEARAATSATSRPRFVL